MTVKEKVQGMIQAEGVRAVHVWAGREPVVDESKRMYEAKEPGVLDRTGVLSYMSELFPDGVVRKLEGAVEYIMFPASGGTKGFTVRKVV